MTIILAFTPQQHLVRTKKVWSIGSVGLRWCECNRLTLMRTKSAGQDLPEELVSVRFQTNPGMVRLRCESERSSIRSSSKKHRPYASLDVTGTRSAALIMGIIVWLAVTPRLAAHCRTVGWKWVVSQHGVKRRRNVYSIFGQRPHETYALKQT